MKLRKISAFAGVLTLALLIFLPTTDIKPPLESTTKCDCSTSQNLKILSHSDVDKH